MKVVLSSSFRWQEFAFLANSISQNEEVIAILAEPSTQITRYIYELSSDYCDIEICTSIDCLDGIPVDLINNSNLRINIFIWNSIADVINCINKDSTYSVISGIIVFMLRGLLDYFPVDNMKIDYIKDYFYPTQVMPSISPIIHDAVKKGWVQVRPGFHRTNVISYSESNSIAVTHIAGSELRFLSPSLTQLASRIHHCILFAGCINSPACVLHSILNEMTKKQYMAEDIAKDIENYLEESKATHESILLKASTAVIKLSSYIGNKWINHCASRNQQLILITAIRIYLRTLRRNTYLAFICNSTIAERIVIVTDKESKPYLPLNLASNNVIFDKSYNRLYLYSKAAINLDLGCLSFDAHLYSRTQRIIACGGTLLSMHTCPLSVSIEHLMSPQEAGILTSYSSAYELLDKAYKLLGI